MVPWLEGVGLGGAEGVALGGADGVALGGADGWAVELAGRTGTVNPV